MGKYKEASESRVISLITDIKSLLKEEEIQDKWLDITKASNYCDMSPSTLRRNVKQGNLKASKVTGKLLFKRSELENWLTKEGK